MLQDIHEIKENAVTKQELTEKLNPLQKEIDDLKKRLSEVHVSGGHYADFLSTEQIQMMNAVDPAKRQLSFKGFKDMSPGTRVAYLDILF